MPVRSGTGRAASSSAMAGDGAGCACSGCCARALRAHRSASALALPIAGSGWRIEILDCKPGLRASDRFQSATRNLQSALANSEFGIQNCALKVKLPADLEEPRLQQF